MSTPTNNTHEDVMVDPVAQARFPLMVSIYIPLFLISSMGNGFVIYSLTYLKRSQRTVVDSYILNLAVGDILMTTLSLFNATEYLKNEWTLGEVTCKIQGQMMEAVYTVSTFTLLAISYNRRNVVKDPFRILDARKTLKKNILIIWFAALALTSPLLYAYTVAKRNGKFHCSNTNFGKIPRSIYYLLQAVILFFVPVAVMIVSQRKIAKGLRQHSEIYKSAMECENTHWKRVMTHEKKIGKFLTWIWVIFVCCFAPFITMRTINHFTSLRRIERWNQFWHASQLIALLNSAINPFLYYRTTNKDIAKAKRITKLFCCIGQKNKRSSGCKSQTSSDEKYAMNSLISKK